MHSYTPTPRSTKREETFATPLQDPSQGCIWSQYAQHPGGSSRGQGSHLNSYLIGVSSATGRSTLVSSTLMRSPVVHIHITDTSSMGPVTRNSSVSRTLFNGKRDCRAYELYMQTAFAGLPGIDRVSVHYCHSGNEKTKLNFELLELFMAGVRPNPAVRGKTSGYSTVMQNEIHALCFNGAFPPWP